MALPASELFVGLMSGTSIDAIDAVLVDLSKPTPRLIRTHSETIPADLKQELISLARYSGQEEIQRMGRADACLGRLFAQAVTRLLQLAGLSSSDPVAGIGCHGQTIRHCPNISTPFSLQIGDPNIIAELTGITTIADFRRRDIAAGGQGAPLVPAFHAALFQDSRHPRTVLNIGGIANITILPTNDDSVVTGFDTGPGNTLLDAWHQHHRGSAVDRDGEWAASGKTDPLLLERLLSDPYFHRRPPKSTGPEYFNLAWLEKRLINTNLPPADAQATLTSLTAASVAAAITNHAGNSRELLVCGGGVHNRSLMGALEQALPDLAIDTTDALGIPPDWVEATAFAWLAKQTLLGLPANLPSVTGATRPVVLGAIYIGRKPLGRTFAPHNQE